MPLSRRAAWRAAALLVAAGASLHCGARSELKVPPPLPPEPECNINSDCPGFDDPCAPSTCVLTSRYVGELPELPPGVPLPPKVCVVLDERDCDDGDPCTADSCDSETGECVYGPATLDLDEDGHNAPLPGTVAGTPEACGDDCNDASAEAFPGNPEVCDGVDNDCNGVVDDDASFEPLGAGPVRVSGDIAPAGPGGIGFNGDDYLSVYSGTSGGFAMYATRLDPEGNKLDPIEERIALQNADSSGGPIVWIGDRYGLAWEDRRDGNYEAYFTLLDGQGAKVIADTRLSFSPGFSVNVGSWWCGKTTAAAFSKSWRSGSASTVFPRATTSC
jgi:hypothetical protein